MDIILSVAVLVPTASGFISSVQLSHEHRVKHYTAAGIILNEMVFVELLRSARALGLAEQIPALRTSCQRKFGSDLSQRDSVIQRFGYLTSRKLM